jgi:hypothetical protein
MEPQIRLMTWKEERDQLTFLLGSVFQDDLINDLSANNTSPSEVFVGAIKELLIGHQSTASVASHHRSISCLLALST